MQEVYNVVMDTSLVNILAVSFVYLAIGGLVIGFFELIEWIGRHF